jgi:predicted RNA-binding Zn ribbon-like protein
LIAAIALLVCSPGSVRGQSGPDGSSLEDANKDLKSGEEGPVGKEDEAPSLEDANKELKGEDEEPAEKINPIEKLMEIARLMREATDYLINAAKQGDSAIRKQGEAAGEIEKLIDPAEQKQAGAISEIDRLMKDTEDKQSKSVDELEKLIRMAREMQSESQSQSQQPQPQDSQKQPKPKEEPKDSERSKNPAQKPYQVPPRDPSMGERPNIADLKDKWGELPPKLREEIMLKMLDELLPEYEERVLKFYKLLNELD